VAGSDEDSLTLAVAAGLEAVHHGEVDPTTIGGLYWGTARPPMAEGPTLPMLAAALGLTPGIAGLLASGSTHAGIDALTAAWHAISAGAIDTALVIASDALSPALGSSGEASTGSGAAAWVLTGDRGNARLLRSVTTGRPVLDRYRGDGEPATRDDYDGRLHREQWFVPDVAAIAARLRDMAGDTASGTAASTAAATAAGRPAGDLRWALPDPDRRLGRAAVEAAQADPDAVVSTTAVTEIGDTGAAAPFIGIIDALGVAGPAAIVAHGGGRTTGLLLEVDEAVPGTDLATALAASAPAGYGTVLRARQRLVPDSETVPMGIPPGSAMLARETDELLRLLGARCSECDAVSTPPSVHPTCAACGSPKLTTTTLPRTGTVHTFVINHTMPAPFEAPLPIIVVDLDDGSRTQVQGASDGSDIAIGAPVRLVLRRYATERGVPIYGYKAVVTGQEG